MHWYLHLVHCQGIRKCHEEIHITCHEVAFRNNCFGSWSSRKNDPCNKSLNKQYTRMWFLLLYICWYTLYSALSLLIVKHQKRNDGINNIFEFDEYCAIISFMKPLMWNVYHKIPTLWSDVVLLLQFYWYKTLCCISSSSTSIIRKLIAINLAATCTSTDNTIQSYS